MIRFVSLKALTRQPVVGYKKDNLHPQVVFFDGRGIIRCDSPNDIFSEFLESLDAALHNVASPI